MRSAQFRTFILNQKGKRRERGRQISILKDAKAPPGGGGGLAGILQQGTPRKKKKK